MSDDLDQRIVEAARELDSVVGTVRDRTALEGRMPRAYDEALKTMEGSVWVDAHWEIGWPTLPRGVKAKIIAVTQKLVRAAVAWYTERITADQNRYNYAVYRTLRLLSEEVRDLRTRQVHDQAHIEALRGEVAELRHRLAEEDGGA